MKYPNLYILGAPKCGTTAMAHWLSSHPQVFVPTVKEPHFFSTEYRLTPYLSQYLSLFANWSCGERWAVDASVWSLYSSNAVPEIIKVRPDAKFIVMIRNPVELVPSTHRQQVFNGNELEHDLGRALSFDSSRRQGKSIRVAKDYPADHLAYLYSCALGWQVHRLLSLVERDRVQFIVHDRLKANPRDVLAETFDFLEVGHDFPDQFEVINAAKIRRSYAVDKVARGIGRWKSRRGIRLRFGMLSWIRRKNRKVHTIPPIDNSLREMLTTTMVDDVGLLEECIKTSLADWRVPTDRIASH